MIFRKDKMNQKTKIFTFNEPGILIHLLISRLKAGLKCIPLPALVFILFIPITLAATSSVGNNNTGTVSQASSDGGSGGDGGTSDVVVEGDDITEYVSPSFSAAQGTDTVQVGSLLFGSITVSRDARTLELRRNMSTVAAMKRENLINEKTAKEYAEWTVTELKRETKPRKCLAFIPCGRERSIRNLFGLLW